MLDELRFTIRYTRFCAISITASWRSCAASTAGSGPPEEIEIRTKLELPVAAFRERLAKLSFGGLISLDTTVRDGSRTRALR